MSLRKSWYSWSGWLAVFLIIFATVGFFVVYPWCQATSLRREHERKLEGYWSYTEAFKMLHKAELDGMIKDDDLKIYCNLYGLLAASQTQAMKWWHKMARQGDADAQYMLGNSYSNGFGGKMNHSAAAKWYRKAAEQGHAGAQAALHYSYKYGTGVTKNEAEAAKWYAKAIDGYREIAEQGDTEAQIRLAFLLEKREEKIKWLLAAAEQGAVRAYVFLAEDAIYNGGGYAEAIEWYRRAAEQGYARAQFDLGLCYEMGNGVEKDETKAVKWYLKAAEKRGYMAQYRLGKCYEEGKGVEKNLGEALKWYRNAAKATPLPKTTVIDAIKRLEALEKESMK